MWESLPSDLIIAVAKRLQIADFARFRSVCTAWASAVKDFHPSSSPWLYPKTVLDLNRLSFFDCSDDRYYHLSLPANISAAGTSVRLLGLRGQWMVFLLDEADRLRPVVVNPLSGTHLRLPSLHLLPCARPYRPHDSYTIIPFPEHDVAFIIYGYPEPTNLAFMGPGDRRWAHVDSRQRRIVRHCLEFKDVVYHDGRFYTICLSGQMLALELNTILDSTTASTVFLAHNKFLSPDVSYLGGVFLVSSPSGDLLQIRNRDRSSCFVVMKYDTEADGWAEIKDLGDSCIFVDKWQAMLLPAEDDGVAWPRLRRNCIYYAGSPYYDRDERLRVLDVRVFKVGSTSTGKPCTSKFDHPLCWFRPSFA